MGIDEGGAEIRRGGDELAQDGAPPPADIVDAEVPDPEGRATPTDDQSCRLGEAAMRPVRGLARLPNDHLDRILIGSVFGGARAAAEIGRAGVTASAHALGMSRRRRFL